MSRNGAGRGLPETCDLNGPAGPWRSRAMACPIYKARPNWAKINDFCEARHFPWNQGQN